MEYITICWRKGQEQHYYIITYDVRKKELERKIREINKKNKLKSSVVEWKTPTPVGDKKEGGR